MKRSSLSPKSCSINGLGQMVSSWTHSLSLRLSYSRLGLRSPVSHSWNRPQVTMLAVRIHYICHKVIALFSSWHNQNVPAKTCQSRQRLRLRIAAACENGGNRNGNGTAGSWGACVIGHWPGGAQGWGVWTTEIRGRFKACEFRHTNSHWNRQVTLGEFWPYMVLRTSKKQF